MNIEIEDNKDTFLSKLQYCNYDLTNYGILFNKQLIKKFTFINDDGVAETESLSKNIDIVRYNEILKMIEEIYDQDGFIKIVLFSSKSYNCDDNKNNINIESNVESNNYNDIINLGGKKKSKRKSKRKSNRKRRSKRKNKKFMKK